jgi:hypothetical protein
MKKEDYKELMQLSIYGELSSEDPGIEEIQIIYLSEYIAKNFG